MDDVPSAFLSEYRAFVYQLVHRTWRALPDRSRRLLDVDDLYQDAATHVLACALQYDPARGKPQTYFGRVVAHHLSRLLRDEIAEDRRRAEGLDLGQVAGPDDPHQDLEFKILVRQHLGRQYRRERRRRAARWRASRA